jgi:3-oxoacyl-[acyl-carrier protein] reductase
MPNKIDLSGRFAVVTGGGRGIGRAPSSCKTELLKDFDEEFIRAMLAKVPRGRIVLTEEIAAAAFCASRECSFTTGGVFDIAGGRATY